jgi:acetaldehyde dehydrogenase (acetylating)
VVDAPLVDEVKRQFVANGAHFLNAAEIDAVGRVLVSPQRLPNPALVGRPATYIAREAGITVAPTTRVLIGELAGVGRDYPLSIEKLCPVLSFYVVADWREGCERCKQILRYGGMGHTMSIHSRNDDVILQFGLKKPAFRIVVNTPTTHGSIGLSTGLEPAMTLGCGGYGGNITSDNISPRHLLNIKRLAYEVAPVSRVPAVPAAASVQPLPKAPAAAAPPPGIAAGPLARRIDQFLASRGYVAPGVSSSGPVKGENAPPDATPAQSRAPVNPSQPVSKPLDFVCEDDVRQALRQGRKLVIGERTIVTPAARDLGEQHHLFVPAEWPR